MKNYNKRLLAFAMACVMLLGMCPAFGVTASSSHYYEYASGSDYDDRYSSDTNYDDWYSSDTDYDDDYVCEQHTYSEAPTTDKP